METSSIRDLGIDIGTMNSQELSYHLFLNKTSDSDGDNVSYFFDWGDFSNSGWTEFVPSGASVSRGHRWLLRGTYIIKVKAKDVYGLEGDWKTLTVTMPRDKATTSLLFFRFLERFPLLQKILFYFIK